MRKRSADELAPGRVLAGFEVIRILGEGGMSIVYLARQISLGREVALKVLRRHLLSDPEEQVRFLQEGRLAAQIRQARLVPIVDVGEADGLLYLAYEVVRGPTLRRLLAGRGPQSPQLAIEVGVACAEVLEVLHGKGVLHRDIKAENIFLSDDRGVLVGDLGLAKVLENPAVQTQKGIVLGTLAYLPPETLKGTPPSAATDLYALGIVLYECLAGDPPFLGEDVMKVLLRHANEPIPSLSSLRHDVPAELESIMLKLLEKEPSRRFSDARAVRAALARLSKGGAEPTGDAVRRARESLRLSSSELRVAPRAAGRLPVRLATLTCCVFVAMVAGAAGVHLRKPATAPPPARAAVEAVAASPWGDVMRALRQAEEACRLLDKASPPAPPDVLARRVTALFDENCARVERALQAAMPAIRRGDRGATEEAGLALIELSFLGRTGNTSLRAVFTARQRKMNAFDALVGHRVTSETMNRLRAIDGVVAARLLRSCSILELGSAEPSWCVGAAGMLTLARWDKSSGSEMRDVKTGVLGLVERALATIVSRKVSAAGDLFAVRAALRALDWADAVQESGPVVDRTLEALKKESGGFDPQRELVYFQLAAFRADAIGWLGEPDANRAARYQQAARYLVGARDELRRRWPYDPSGARPSSPTTDQAKAAEYDEDARAWLARSTARLAELSSGGGPPATRRPQR